VASDGIATKLHASQQRLRTVMQYCHLIILVKKLLSVTVKRRRRQDTLSENRQGWQKVFDPCTLMEVVLVLMQNAEVAHGSPQVLACIDGSVLDVWGIATDGFGQTPPQRRQSQQRTLIDRTGNQAFSCGSRAGKAPQKF